jgi:endonuclease-3 related protein
MKIIKIYEKLLEHFGTQGWWPVRNNFKPNELEICIGAILTQNTSWKGVEKALSNLKKANCTDIEHILKIRKEKLEYLIKPSGFYHQKAERLKTFCRFLYNKHIGCFKDISREELLGIKGIGPETADSILLYACDKPFFVIDAYTKRIFSCLGFINKEWEYERCRRFFEKNLPKDLNIYKEFHALIVRLGKEYCKTKPLCRNCPINKMCNWYSNKQK